MSGNKTDGKPQESLLRCTEHPAVLMRTAGWRRTGRRASRRAPSPSMQAQAQESAGVHAEGSAELPGACCHPATLPKLPARRASGRSHHQRRPSHVVP
eukprot:scaffold119659_cov48-Phaeocystis_antarctica.AAC.1